MTSRPITVLLADGVAGRLGEFRRVLEHESDIEPVAVVENGVEAVSRAHAIRPDAVLADLRLPKLDGIATTRTIATTPGLEHVRVLVLAPDAGDIFAYGALQAGASGFLLHECAPVELTSAIRAAVAEDELPAPDLTCGLVARLTAADSGTAADEERLAALTGRDREIVTLVGNGLRDTEIADRLDLHTSAVRILVSQVMSIVRARVRAQLVIFAYRSGLVIPRPNVT